MLSKPENLDQNSSSASLMPENYVIVIGRQFGSGGRTIGKIVATRLGCNYYDTELIKKAAESEGVDPLVIKEHEEKKPSFLKTLLQGAYGIADNFHTVPLSSERIYQLQSNVIKDLCRKGGNIVVGRNADFILKDHPFLLSVFLHSPIEQRVKRILKRQEAADEQTAYDLASQQDRRRESFYNFYTGEKRWGIASNYDLSINTSFMDNETVADIIVHTAQKKFKEKI